MTEKNDPPEVKLYTSFVTRSIVPCEQCSGSGIHVKSVLSDYHRREYDTVTDACYTCDGAGRMICTQTTARVRVSFYGETTVAKLADVHHHELTKLGEATTASFYNLKTH